MSMNVKDVLHQIHTATNDVLEGYGVMLNRAEREIRPTIILLTQIHERHANAQRAALSNLGESADGDMSWQGTMNKAVITMRDWVSGLDEEALASVRQGEESLLDIYDEAMADWPAGEAPDVSTMLTEQFQEISDFIGVLPEA